MTKHLRFYQYLMATLLITLMLACSSGGDSDDSDPPIDNDVIPTNLTLTIDIVGIDSSNPNGNGSGMVNVQLSATNAVRFGVKFGNEDIIESSNGTFSKTFTQTGTINYLISVFAYSSTNNSISTFQSIAVFVDNDQLQLVWSDEFNVEGAPNYRCLKKAIILLMSIIILLAFSF